MKVSGGSVFPLAPQTLWAMLNDPDVLRRCAPGCEQLEKTDGGAFTGRMKIGVGSIKGTYRCEMRIESTAPPDAYTLSLSGQGALGSIEGRIRVTLAPRDGGATALSYEGQVDVGGVIATVGQPLLKSVADYQTKEFFDRLREEAARRSGRAGPAAPG